MPVYQGRIFRQKLQSDPPVLGAWISSTDPSVARAMINVGLDFLLIDLEHSAINLETLQHILMLFQNSPTCPLVRVPWHERSWVKWALDCGAEGIVFPNVTSVEEARQAVALCKYPPQGIRGYFPRAASNFLSDTGDYLSDVNQRIQVWIQIEDINAVAQLDDIFGVEGIDGVLVGPADFTLSMGLLGQFDHPLFIEALQKIIAAGKHYHIPIVYPADDSSATAIKVLRLGCQAVTVGMDWWLAMQAARDRVEEIRKGLAG